MDDKPLTTEQILTMLAATPAYIANLTQSIPSPQLLLSPEPGVWSARDILAHLRSCSDMWGKYIAIILNEDRPTIKAVNPRTWMKQTNYLEQEFLPSLEAFTTQRNDLLNLLRSLGPEDWTRMATVTGAGKPRERTVYTYAEWLASHEKSHYKEIKRLANALLG